MEQKRCQSLYQQWQTVARTHQGQIAVEDTLAGKSWTFQQLANWAEQLPAAVESSAAQGRGMDFLAAVLRGWRDDRAVVPLEESATFPVTGKIPDDIAHIKTTSGSTGSPRLVFMTADQLAADAAHIVSTMGLRRDWPNVAAISLAHSYGFSNLVLPLLLHGIPLILAPNPLPETLRQVLTNRSAVTLPAVPALWRSWHAAGVIDRRVKLAVSAGAPLAVEMEKLVFESTGVKIHNFYGSSECGGIAYDRTVHPRTDSRLAGTAMEGVQLRVNAESGVLEVRGAAVAKGYAEPDSVLRDGVFTTPDLAEIIPDGGVILMGRTGESIHVAGRKIAPSLIEEKLSALPGVRHCVVFGVPSADSTRIEEIVAGVNLARDMTLESLRATAARHLPPGQQPRHWFPDSGITPDVRGKISRADWRAKWLASSNP